MAALAAIFAGLAVRPSEPPRGGGTSAPGQVASQIEELGARAKRLGGARNTTIIINGRKFDQVESIECVDDKFYELLMKDLELVRAERRLDYYGSYHDYEYAKAVSAIVEGPSSGDKRDPESRPPGELDVLAAAKSFWGETAASYLRAKAQLEPANPKRLGGGGKHERALANRRYLLQRLEQLKALLLNGEEALVLLNNRVRKLNKAVGERELQQALCSCITGRAGRAALMLVSELFVDKDSARFSAKPEAARKRASEAARDTAEFCSFWYGDTIRSEMKQNERLIRRLALQVAGERRGLNRTSDGGAEFGPPNASRATKWKAKILESLIEMGSLWVPEVVEWIKNRFPPAKNESRSLVDASEPAAKLEEALATVLPSSSAERELAPSRKSRSISAGEWAELPAAELEALGQAELLLDAAEGVPESDWRWARHRERRSSQRDPRTWDHKSASAAANHKASRPAPQRAKTSPASTRKPISASWVPPSRAPLTDFEMRISKRTSECAADGFRELLAIARQLNELMYAPNGISEDDIYIKTLANSFAYDFAISWAERRDHWSRSFEEKGGEFAQLSQSGRSVDEEMDDTFDSAGSSYERGARLGFTIGKFIGEKAARQWPDPAELNTFTYDSIFLAGVGRGHSESDSKGLERRIVAETAKRVAFVEANRKAFAKSVHAAFLSGASLAPVWGLLHAQRLAAKQVAKLGAKVGFEAGSLAAAEFAPKAVKFLATHRHQRELAAPYKRARQVSDKWAGFMEQIEAVKVESELNRNVLRSAIECGQKSGTLMGALVGLLVAPEALETYIRFRGSLEALESQFNQYKLGAMRGYELAESWAYLNHTAAMSERLDKMKAQTGSRPSAGSPRPELNQSAANESSVFETSGLSATNTNNLFQFMVLNYGTHLVANHSHKHMLKLRATSIDEGLLRELIAQTGDLMAESEAEKLGQAGPFEGDGGRARFSGELVGDLNLARGKAKRRVKFNLINLGARLEFSDELAKESGGGGGGGNNSSGSLPQVPLTSALTNVDKLFAKFCVARVAKPDLVVDDLSKFLAASKRDEGDGYLSGVFNPLASQPNNGGPDEHPGDDDLSVEASILDELFLRIEGEPANSGAVSMVQRLMGVTTLAPRKLEEVAAAGSKASGSTRGPPGPAGSRSSETGAEQGKLEPDDQTVETTTTTTTTTSTTTTTTPTPTTTTPTSAETSESPATSTDQPEQV